MISDFCIGVFYFETEFHLQWLSQTEYGKESKSLLTTMNHFDYNHFDFIGYSFLGSN